MVTARPQARWMVLAVLALVVVALGVTAFALAEGGGGCARGAGAGGGCRMMGGGGGCGVGAGSGCPAGRPAAPALTRALPSGTVALRLGRGGALIVAVLGGSNKPDANASVSGELIAGGSRVGVDWQRLGPGVFGARPDLKGATELALRVSSLGTSNVVYFGLPAAGGGCPMVRGGACPMAKGGGCPAAKGQACPMAKGGACPMMKDGACPMARGAASPGMKAGGCPMARQGAGMQGGCRMMKGGCPMAGQGQAAGKTAACKCAECKCTPCRCK